MPVTTVSTHMQREHYQVAVLAGKNALIADEHEDHGGKEIGFNPYELLLASLGSCTSATLRMYADRKNIPLDEIRVELTLERDDDNNVSNINCNVTLVGNLSDADRARLLTIAHKCPVHKLLTTPINIKTELV